MEKKWSNEAAIKNGSLSVNGNMVLGNEYNGKYYSSKPGENYVIFGELKGSLVNTLHAALPQSDCAGLTANQDIKIRITFIYKNAGMNAEVVK